MQLDQRLAAGLGGLLAGAVLAYAAGSAGQAELEAQLARQGDTLASVAAIDAALARLDARVDSGLAELAGRMEAQAAGQEAPLAALAQQVERLSAELPGTVAGLGMHVRGALAGDLETLAREVAALAPPAPAPTAVAEAVEPVAAPVGLAEGSVAIRLGQSLPVGEGLRVFLSGLDGTAGTARVAVNGVTTTTVRLGEAAASGDCALTLTGIDGRAASFSGSCLAAAPATPEARIQEAAIRAEAPVSAEPPAGTLRIGQTAILADGAMRIFLSSVDAEQGIARIAANGLRPGAVAYGMPIEVGACSVTMTHIQPGMAAFDANCADEAAGAIVPAVAVPGEAAAAISEGTELRVGQTTVLSDNLRVFLSAVDSEAGTARVAINGTGLTTLALALPHAAGDCTVQLVGIDARTAVLGGAC